MYPLYCIYNRFNSNDHTLSNLCICYYYITIFNLKLQNIYIDIKFIIGLILTVLAFFLVFSMFKLASANKYQPNAED